MSHTRQYLETLSALEQAGRPFVAVTLVDAVGSTPQDVGAKMLVDAAGLVLGTVGGGRVEQRALTVAAELLAADSRAGGSRFVEWNLQRDIGMTCGGAVKLYFELCGVSSWRIAVFGAGHVAQSLVRILLPLHCQLICLDPRQEWLDRLPNDPRLQLRRTDDLAAEVDTLALDDFVICMTMGHRTDRPILERIFKSGRQFAFLGVIGSQAKRKVLVRELRDAGVPAERSEQFVCPIGLPVGNNQPHEIAISIAAQLLQVRDVRRPAHAPPADAAVEPSTFDAAERQDDSA